MSYHIANGDQPQGPYTLEGLRHADLRPDTLVWRDGMPEWRRADDVPELQDLLAELRAVAAVGPAHPEPDTFEVTIPTEPQPAQPVTPHPAFIQQPAPHYAGAALPYATGGYAPGAGPLPTGMAITSMVLGIIALLFSFFALCLWILSGPLAVAAIVVGHIARANANRGIAGGAGMALAGLICGYFALALTAFFMLGFFGLMLGA